MTYGGESPDRTEFRWIPCDHIHDSFLFPFPTYFPSDPVPGKSGRIWLPFPEGFRTADPTIFLQRGYGPCPAVSCPVKISGYGHPATPWESDSIHWVCSSHIHITMHKPVSCVLTISNIFRWFVRIEICFSLSVTFKESTGNHKAANK
jgi:hypothetical protein